MELTKQDIKAIHELNANIKVLLGGQRKESEDKFLSYSEAMNFLNRKRSWIQRRLKIEFDPTVNINEYLVKDVDWRKYHRQIEFKKSSLERLKETIVSQSK